MTQSQAKKVPKVIRYADIAERVKALRNGLEYSQSEFAEKLKVSRTQIVAWEMGVKERPSTEKLLEMAKWAKTLEDKTWFLRKAGLDLDALKAVFRDELKSTSSPNPVESGLVSVLPVINGFRIDEGGAVAPRVSDRGEFHVSAQCVAHPGSTVGIVVPPEARLLGSLCFPLSVGDLVLVDRTQIYPSDFIDRPLDAKRLAVLLFPRIPEYLDTEVGRPNVLHAPYPAGDDLPAEMKCPVALFGWLSEQRAGGDVKELLGAKNQWRLFFVVGPSGGFALTEWMKDRLPRDIGSSEMLHGARIFGSVIGWMNTSGARLEARGFGEV